MQMPRAIDLGLEHGDEARPVLLRERAIVEHAGRMDDAAQRRPLSFDVSEYALHIVELRHVPLPRSIAAPRSSTATVWCAAAGFTAPHHQMLRAAFTSQWAGEPDRQATGDGRSHRTARSHRFSAARSTADRLAAM
jgi:hypothetical protein